MYIKGKCMSLFFYMFIHVKNIELFHVSNLYLFYYITIDFSFLLIQFLIEEKKIQFIYKKKRHH